MSKKKIIIFVTISILLILIILVLANNKKRKILSPTEIADGKTKISESLYDEKTGLYYLKDEETRRNNNCKLRRR